MFKFCSLFSGSTGNSLFVETENSKILVDAGESAKKIVSALSLIGIEVTDIDAILVTHEHIDHVKSLGTLSKKYNIPVYANENTWNAMPEQQGKILEENQKYRLNLEDGAYSLKIFRQMNIHTHRQSSRCIFHIIHHTSFCRRQLQCFLI